MKGSWETDLLINEGFSYETFLIEYEVKNYLWWYRERRIDYWGRGRKILDCSLDRRNIILWSDCSIGRWLQTVSCVVLVCMYKKLRDVWHMGWWRVSTFIYRESNNRRETCPLGHSSWLGVTVTHLHPPPSSLSN